MNKLLKLFLLLVCVFSLTVWSCKPTEKMKEDVPVTTKPTTHPSKSTPVDLKTLNIDGCLYGNITKGIATITQLDGSNTSEAIIKFSFESNSGSKNKIGPVETKRERFNVIGVGQYPPRKWALDNGLVQDAEIPCIRYELDTKKEQGSNCKTVVYDFPQFKNNNWDK
jgi:hypothetical protein